MNCLSENLIQAQIDGELETTLSESALAHINQCSSCRTTYERLLANNEFCKGHLSDFGIATELFLDAKEGAGALMKEDHSVLTIRSLYDQANKAKKGETSKMKKYQKWIATAAVFGLMVGGMTLEPVRAAVGDAVSIFRAQEIKTFDVSFDDLRQIEQAIESKSGTIDIENLAKVNQSGGDTQAVQASEAQGLVNFPLAELAGAGDSKLESVEVTSPQQLDMVLNIKNVNALMETLGATTLFDEALDGQKITLSMPAVVTQQYADSKTGRFIRFTQTKLPEISAPEGTEVSDLVSAIASMGILPPNLQSQLLSLSNPNQTLYLPNVDGMLEKMSVGSGQEVFYHLDTDMDTDNPYGYAIWLDQGILKSLHGNFDKAHLVELIEGAN